MAASLPESTRPEAVALVLWQGDGFLHVTVRVGRGGGQWVARALSFSERDSISERWTTVGLTVATLVGETRALEAKPADEPAAVAPSSPPPDTHLAAVPSGSVSSAATPAPSRPPVAVRSSETATPAWQGRLGALAGPGWDAGGWRLGGWLSLGYQLPRTPLVVNLVGSYASSSGPRIRALEPSTRWSSVGAGVGASGTWRALNVAGSAAIEVAYRRVDVDVEGQRASDEDVPVSLRGLASFPARGPLAATAGFVMRLPPQSSNETSGLTVRGPAFAAELVAGLEVRL